jgi:2-polyprenyl-3-methyl-5-hydroxy-6-metoxy-1,4-benzoquinol methylase
MKDQKTWSGTVASAYDRGSAGYAQSWTTPHPWMEECRYRFAGLVSPGKTLIDIGCGPGHDSAYWAAKGLRTLGIDISAKTIEGARRLYPALEFEVMDALELEKFYRYFDVAWMAYSLLHISRETAPAVIAAVHSRLHKNGLFFIETPILESTQESLRPIAGLKDENGREIEVPYTAWSIDDLTALLKASFTIEWTKTYAPLPARPKSWSAILRPV